MTTADPGRGLTRVEILSTDSGRVDPVKTFLPRPRPGFYQGKNLLAPTPDPGSTPPESGSSGLNPSPGNTSNFIETLIKWNFSGGLWNNPPPRYEKKNVLKLGFGTRPIIGIYFTGGGGLCSTRAILKY